MSNLDHGQACALVQALADAIRACLTLEELLGPRFGLVNAGEQVAQLRSVLSERLDRIMFEESRR